jgi:hypothetical protein
MQEYYMLFGIFAKDVGLYFLSVFYIARADFQYTNVYLFCVLHTYHCVPFTGECHGKAAYKAQTTSICDVIGHRLILFLPRVWTQSVPWCQNVDPLSILSGKTLSRTTVGSMLQIRRVSLSLHVKKNSFVDFGKSPYPTLNTFPVTDNSCCPSLIITPSLLSSLIHCWNCSYPK